MYEAHHIEKVFEEIEKNFMGYFGKYIASRGGIVVTNEAIETLKEKMKINSNIKISIDSSKYQKNLEAIKNNAIKEFDKDVEEYEELFDLDTLEEYAEDPAGFKASYDCYSQLIKRLPFLKDLTEMLFLFIKDYHRVESEQRFNFGIPSISEEISDWIDKTWEKYQVNLLAFAYGWINSFYENEDVWPSTHRKKSQYTCRNYDYDYKQKSNLFNLDSLYRKMPKKSFTKERKQEFEILFMYYWLHDMEGDNDYWQEYLEMVLPALKKQ